MRIVVNDIAASEGGALSVLKDFYEAVKEFDEENEYIFLISNPYLEETERIKVVLLPDVKNSRIKKMIFDFITGKKFISRLNPDVVLSLQNIITFGLKIPQVVYVHQSIPYQNVKRYSFFRKTERKFALIQYGIGSIIHMSVRKASKVIVQTKWMKDAVIHKTKIHEDKIHVVPPTICPDHDNVSDVEFQKNRFFYPTSNEAYKNNELVNEACKILQEEWNDFADVEMTLDETFEHSNMIRMIGRISREDVLKKYKQATLIFPSYIETFGMPLAEAAAENAIILAADCDYAREVLEEYENVKYFDYKNAKALAGYMHMVINGEITRKSSTWLEKQNGFNSWLKVIRILESVVKK